MNLYEISIRGHRNADFFPIGTINKRDSIIDKRPLYKDFKNG